MFAQTVSVVLSSLAVMAPSQGTLEKLPVPDQATQQATLKVVKEVYESDYKRATSRTAKVALANKMVQTAIATDQDPTGRYVLLHVARNIAIKQGDVDTAFTAIDQMATDYDVNVLQFKSDSAAGIAKVLRKPEEHLEFVLKIGKVVNEAINVNRFDIARSTMELALSSAEKSENAELTEQTQNQIDELVIIEEEYHRTKHAMTVLQDEPADLEANAVVGKFHCFVKNDWDIGIPMLAVGADVELRKLATMELADRPDPLALGDGWWEFSASEEAPDSRLRIRARAAYWYRKSLPNLTGLARRKVEKRLSGIANGVDTSALTQPSGPFDVRRNEVRQQRLEDFGGTADTESAVALALQWFANHQNPDGSWSFDHRVSPMCQGRCPDHGSFTQARNGATAMALLPFLGAGQTHREGKYKQVVHRGLNYLISKQRNSTKGPGGLWEERGQMYSHGLCAIALCEAYGMTRDRELMRPAQLSLDFISSAQDPAGGGWRYQIRERGDTSVGGWQVMALKSGHMANLNVNSNTIKGAYKYLDSVQADSGSAYGYTDPGNGQATSAIGLLCRMYLGWKNDHRPLQRGTERLSGIGPSDHNMYSNYYATQVMWHYGGEHWTRWNPVMRDSLVNSQNKAGHTKGSWNFQDPLGASGGRVYCTSLATLILEVYYRYKRVY